MNHSAWAKFLVAAGLVSLGFGFAIFAQAAVPSIVNYQGRLENASGNLIGGSGANFDFRFSIWNSVSGGSRLWPASAPASTTLAVTNGVFSVGLGDTSVGFPALDLNFNSATPYYLQIEVWNTTSSQFEAMNPRQAINAAGFAINAGTLNSFTQGTSSNNILQLNASGSIDLPGGQLRMINSASCSTLTALGSGALCYDTTSNGLFVYSSASSSWQSLAGGTSGALIAVNNLSDLASTSTARTNIGFSGGLKITISATGTIGLATSAISQFNNDSGYLTSLSGALLAANNLSDLTNTSTARSNIGFSGGLKILISSTGTIGLATSAVSQFNNDSGYITTSTWVINASGTNIQAINSGGSSTIGFTVNPTFTNLTATNVSGTSNLTIGGYAQILGNLFDTNGNKFSTSTGSVATSSALTAGQWVIAGAYNQIYSTSSQPGLTFTATTSTITITNPSATGTILVGFSNPGYITTSTWVINASGTNIQAINSGGSSTIGFSVNPTFVNVTAINVSSTSNLTVGGYAQIIGNLFDASGNKFVTSTSAGGGTGFFNATGTANGLVIFTGTNTGTSSVALTFSTSTQTFTTASATFTGTISSTISNALGLFNGSGQLTAYGTQSCGNGTAVQVISATGTVSCVSVTATGGNGTVTTSSAITVNQIPYWASIGGGLNGTSSLTFVPATGAVNVSGTITQNGTNVLVITTSSNLVAGQWLIANSGNQIYSTSSQPIITLTATTGTITVSGPSATGTALIGFSNPGYITTSTWVINASGTNIQAINSGGSSTIGFSVNPTFTNLSINTLNVTSTSLFQGTSTFTNNIIASTTAPAQSTGTALLLLGNTAVNFTTPSGTWFGINTASATPADFLNFTAWNISATNTASLFRVASTGALTVSSTAFSVFTNLSSTNLSFLNATSTGNLKINTVSSTGITFLNATGTTLTMVNVSTTGLSASGSIQFLTTPVDTNGNKFSTSTGSVATSSALTAGQWVIAGAYNQIYSTSSQPIITLTATTGTITVSGPSATGTALIGFNNPGYITTSTWVINASGTNIQAINSGGSSTIGFSVNPAFTNLTATNVSSTSNLTVGGYAQIVGSLFDASGNSYATSTFGGLIFTNATGTNLTVTNSIVASTTAPAQSTSTALLLLGNRAVNFGNASGTWFGINTASATPADFINFTVWNISATNTVSLFRVASTGALTVSSTAFSQFTNLSSTNLSATNLSSTNITALGYIQSQTHVDLGGNQFTTSSNLTAGQWIIANSAHSLYSTSSQPGLTFTATTGTITITNPSATGTVLVGFSNPGYITTSTWVINASGTNIQAINSGGSSTIGFSINPTFTNVSGTNFSASGYLQSQTFVDLGGNQFTTSTSLTAGQWIIANSAHSLYSTSSQPVITLNASGSLITVSGPSTTGTAIIGFNNPGFTTLSTSSAGVAGTLPIWTGASSLGLSGYQETTNYQIGTSTLPYDSTSTAFLQIGGNSLQNSAASGTWIGVNASNTFVGSFLTFQTNSTTQFSVSATGTVKALGTLYDASGNKYSTSTGNITTSSALTAGQWVIAGGFNTIYSTSSQPALNFFSSTGTVTVSSPSATGTVLVGFSNPGYITTSTWVINASGTNIQAINSGGSSTIGFSVNPTFTNVTLTNDSSSNITASGYIQVTNNNLFDANGNKYATSTGVTTSTAGIAGALPIWTGASALGLSGYQEKSNYQIGTSTLPYDSTSTAFLIIGSSSLQNSAPSGTWIGINASNTFVGSFLTFQTNSTTQFSVSATGTVKALGILYDANNNQYTTSSALTAGQWLVANSAHSIYSTSSQPIITLTATTGTITVSGPSTTGTALIGFNNPGYITTSTWVVNASGTNIQVSNNGGSSTIGFSVNPTFTNLTATNVSGTSNLTVGGYAQIIGGLFDASGNKYSTSTASVPGGSNTQIQFNNAGSFAGSAGLAWTSSTLAFSISTASTTFTAVPNQTSTAAVVSFGAPIQGGNVSGTYIGVNASSGYNGDFINYQLNSSSQFSVSGVGTLTARALVGLVANPLNMSAGTGGDLFLKAGDGKSGISILNTGNLVGVNTDAPAFQLDVNGAARIIGPSAQTATSALALLGSNFITGGNVSGTFLAANPTSGYNGDFINFQVNSSSKFEISATGTTQIAGNLLDVNGNKYSTSTGGTPGGSNTQLQFNNGGSFAGSAGLAWISGSAVFNISTASTTFTAVPNQTSTSSVIAMGAPIQSGNVSGTYFGINASSGFNGDLVNFQVNSSSKLVVAGGPSQYRLQVVSGTVQFLAVASSGLVSLASTTINGQASATNLTITGLAAGTNCVHEVNGVIGTISGDCGTSVAAQGTLTTSTSWVANALVYTITADGTALNSTSGLSVLSDGTLSSTAMRVSSATISFLVDANGNKYSTSTSGGISNTALNGQVMFANSAGNATGSLSVTINTSTALFSAASGTFSGLLGVGTAAPTAKLDVRGKLNLDNGSADAIITTNGGGVQVFRGLGTAGWTDNVSTMFFQLGDGTYTSGAFTGTGGADMTRFGIDTTGFTVGSTYASWAAPTSLVGLQNDFGNGSTRPVLKLYGNRDQEADYFDIYGSAILATNVGTPLLTFDKTGSLMISGASSTQAAGYALLQLSSSTVQGGNASGTLIGANRVSGYNGALITLQINSSTKFNVASSGYTLFGDGLNASGTITQNGVPVLTTSTWVINASGTNIQVSNNGGSSTVGFSVNPTFASLTVATDTSAANALFTIATATPIFAVSNQGVVTIPNVSGGLLIGGTLTVTSTATFQATSSFLTAVNVGTSTSLANALLTIGTSSNIISFLTNGNAVGNLTNLIATSSPVIQIATTTVGTNPKSIYVSGRYAYVANNNSSTLSIVDLSIPSAPTQVATTSVGNGPLSVFVSGRYAYVANNNSSTLSVVDVSNPSAPIEVSTTTVGANPQSVYVSGRYAYVANSGSSTLSVVDVSNPSVPIQVATTSVGSAPHSVFVSSRYAYVANSGNNTLSVVDVSNPSVPIQVATTSAGGSPQSVYVSGRYAYVANNTGSNNFHVIDVSRPLAPTGVATTTLGTASYSVYVSGRYAYVSDNTSANNLFAVDVSNPSAPVRVATVSVGNQPQSVYVSGRYAYTANNALNTLSVVDISGTETTALIAGSGEFGNIQSRNDIIGQGQLQITGGGSFGQGGLFSAGSLTVSATSTASTILGGLNIGTSTTVSSITLFTIATTSPIFSVSNQGVVTIPNASGGLLIGGTLNVTSTAIFQATSTFAGNIIASTTAPTQVTSTALFLLGNAAANFTTASGTWFGINTATSTGADFLNFTTWNISATNTASLFRVASTGALTVSSTAFSQFTNLSSTNLSSTNMTALGYIQITGNNLFDANGNKYSTSTGISTSSAGIISALPIWTSASGLGVSGYFENSNYHIGTSTLPYDSTSTAFFQIGSSSLRNGVVSGTWIGINASNTFAGNFLTFQKNSSTVFAVSASGSLMIATGTPAPNALFTIATSSPIFSVSNQGVVTAPNASGGLLIGGTLNVTSTATFQVTSTFNANVVIGVLGNLMIGTSTAASPNAQLSIYGGTPVAISSSTTMNAPYAEFAQGRYVYVINNSSNTLQVFDVSVPTLGPVSLATTTTDNGPQSIFVQGKYAYVANFTTSTLQVFDISNPSAPTATGRAVINGSSTGIYVQGRFAYLTSQASNTLQIFDVVNPAAPSLVGSATAGGKPAAVFVQSRYAYVVNNTSNTLQVFDVGNAFAPSSIATTTTQNGPQDLYVQNRYAYVVNNASSSFQIFDIANPSAPTSTSVIATQGGPQHVYVQARYAYIVNNGSSTLQEFDVFTPTSPFLVGNVNTGGGPNDIYVQGRFGFVINNVSSTIQTFDMGGGYIQQLGIGGAEIGTLAIRNSLQGLDAEFQGGLTVMQSAQISGNLGVTGTSTFNAGLFVGGGVNVTGTVTFQATSTLVGNMIARGNILASTTAPSQTTSSALLLLGDTTSNFTTASGTWFGINTASTTPADFINFTIWNTSAANTVSLFRVASTGALTVSSTAFSQFTNLSSTKFSFVNATTTGSLTIGSTTASSSALFTVATTTSIFQVFSNGTIMIEGSSSLPVKAASTTLIVCAKSNCNVGANASNSAAVAFFASAGGSQTDLSIAARGQITGGLADVGEFINVLGDDGDYTAGDLLSISRVASDTFQKTQMAYDPDLAGAVTVTAGLVAGGGDDHHGSNIIALAGRIPVKVTGKNGSIKIGDYLAASDIPGYAMRAAHSGRVLGTAMDDFIAASSSATGTVLTFINPHYEGSLGSAATSSDSGIAITNLGSFDDLAAVRAFAAAASQTSATAAISESYADLVTAGIEIVTPKVTTQNFSIAGIATGTAIRFDTFGNASFAGNVSATAIYANDIESPQLAAIDANIANLSSTMDELSKGIASLASTSESLSSSSAAAASTTANLADRVSALENQMITIQSSTPSIDLQNLLNAVPGTLSLNGALRVNGGLEVNSISAIDGGSTAFNNDVVFFGRPYLNSDSGGFATIAAGGQRVDVTFTQPYVDAPVVNVTMTLDDASNTSALAQAIFSNGISYLVANKSVNGFSVLINRPAPVDIGFSWTAFAVKGAKTFTMIDQAASSTPPDSPPPPPPPQDASSTPPADASSTPTSTDVLPPTISDVASTTPDANTTTTISQQPSN